MDGKSRRDRRTVLAATAVSPLRKELLGHRHVKTTMIYTHVLNNGTGVRSPADSLEDR